MDCRHWCDKEAWLNLAAPARISQYEMTSILRALAQPPNFPPPNPVISETQNHWRRVTHETPHGSNTYTNAVACALF